MTDLGDRVTNTSTTKVSVGLDCSSAGVSKSQTPQRSYNQGPSPVSAFNVFFSCREWARLHEGDTPYALCVML
jgi:hypothetical protein